MNTRETISARTPLTDGVYVSSRASIDMTSRMAEGSSTMDLPRIIDTPLPDHWTEHAQMVRSALDCFAPIAITIRDRPGAFTPPSHQASSLPR